MGWEFVKLGDLVHRKIGYGIVQPGANVDVGVPVIKVNNIISGLSNIELLEKTTTDIDARYTRTRLVGGELVISLVGSVGKTAIVPKTFAGCNLVRATGLIDIKDEILAKWVKYYIDSPLGQAYINSNVNTTVQVTLNIKSLVDMPIPLPEPSIREKIVAILSSIDDKIELNRRINANLEQQAQALYKSWFVDFEFPNEEGQPYKSSGGKMQESELGLIPNYWHVGKLSDIADITMGQSPVGTSYNDCGNGVVFYQGRTEFGFRFPSIKLFTTAPTRYAEPMSVLLSVRAPVGDINIAAQKCCIGRGLASIKSKNNHNSFMYYCLNALKIQLEQYNGEGTVFGSINKKELESLKISIPNNLIIANFNSIINRIDTQILNLSNEINNLSTLRDTLLPKLMSGEIKVPTN